jgi:uncharacterized coiled-coil protein SlyX
MTREWNEARMKELEEGIAFHKRGVQECKDAIFSHERQILSNMGALAILREQLEGFNATSPDNNAA